MPETSIDILVVEASRQMLGKEHPEGRKEWAKVMNFIAWNVDFRTCLKVCRAIARLYNVPLRDKEIGEIVEFQTYDRAARELATQERTAALLNDTAIREVKEFFGGRL